MNRTVAHLQRFLGHFRLVGVVTQPPVILVLMLFWAPVWAPYLVILLAPFSRGSRGISRILLLSPDSCSSHLPSSLRRCIQGWT